MPALTISEQLKQWRKAEGLTMAQAAKRFGMPRASSYQYYESNYDGLVLPERFASTGLPCAIPNNGAMTHLHSVPSDERLLKTMLADPSVRLAAMTMIAALRRAITNNPPPSAA